MQYRTSTLIKIILNLTILALITVVFSYPAYASALQVDGYILNSRHTNIMIEGSKLRKYTLRIRLKDNKSTTSRFITADIIVEQGSYQEASILHAHRQRKISSFIIDKQGMRYHIRSIYTRYHDSSIDTLDGIQIKKLSDVYSEVPSVENKNTTKYSNRIINKSITSGNSSISIGN